MSGRRPRGKARPPLAGRAAPPVPVEETTRPIEMTRELLESMCDESERPTIRLPVRPPFASPDDEASAREQKGTDATIRKRVLVGPDGVARMLDEEELEEATRPFIPTKLLLGPGKGKKKKR